MAKGNYFVFLVLVLSALETSENRLKLIHRDSSFLLEYIPIAPDNQFVQHIC